MKSTPYGSSERKVRSKPQNLPLSPDHVREFEKSGLEHSEDLEDQQLCCRLIADMDEDPKRLDYAKRHRDIVARFGRFPHRNAALGRPSTAEEEVFLKEPDASF